ncbi:MAG TPA: hypothetical protein VK327_16715 [Candidatus Paceibacterota bacterium]|nr:hypothetical protein [Candidatus Paceibacterota bacterium]
MKQTRIWVLGLHIWWGIVLAMAMGGIDAVASTTTDQTLPLLQTKTATYTNVTITSKSAEHVFIVHSGGMTSLRVQELEPETKRALGYVVKEEKKSQPVVVMAKQLVPELQSRIQPYEEKFRGSVPWTREQLQLSRNVIYGIIGCVVILNLFYSYCCHLICIKSKKAPNALVWFPVLKWIPLFRAAEMSAWWLLLMFLPIVPILWSFKIAKARGMSAWVGVFLILPVIGLFAFLYLAFAPEAKQDDGPKYRSMTLQTA